jgi:CelD/BcsL family acetyltransferase involved in cellulose biosynthesis
VLFYQSGLARFEDRTITPGFVAFCLCMQACYERGFSEYDFLAGDSRYKRDLATGARQLVWATATRPAVRWRAMDRLAVTRARLRHD